MGQHQLRQQHFLHRVAWVHAVKQVFREQHGALRQRRGEHPFDPLAKRVRVDDARHGSSVPCAGRCRVGVWVAARSHANCGGQGGVSAGFIGRSPPAAPSRALEAPSGAAAHTMATMPVRTAEGGAGHAATSAARSGSAGRSGGRIGAPTPAPLLPDLLPPESETCVSLGRFGVGSSPVSPIT
jgi:hypothetical protein